MGGAILVMTFPYIVENWCMKLFPLWIIDTQDLRQCVDEHKDIIASVETDNDKTWLWSFCPLGPSELDDTRHLHALNRW